ncbi:hypothetical protein BGZ65_010873, partial [Modicella reniformis]
NIGGLNPDAMDHNQNVPEYPDILGTPGPATMKTLLVVERMIQDFLSSGKPTVMLPFIQLNLRRCLSELAKHYHVRAKTVGSGIRALVRTHNSGSPVGPFNMRELLLKVNMINKCRKAAKAAAKQRHRWSYHLQLRGYDREERDQDSSRRERRGPLGSVVADGTVIGSSASAISVDNVGHRMLSKMGWSPGVGLGASEGGITEPIESVMKRSRRGVGHEQSSGSS